MTPEQLQKLLDDPSLPEVNARDRGEIMVKRSLSVNREVRLQLTGTTIVGCDTPALTAGRAAQVRIVGGQLCTTSRDSAATSRAKDVSTPWRAGCAIEADPSAHIDFEGVQLVGDVNGIPSLAGEWHIPTVISLPSLIAHSRQRFLLRCIVPTNISVRSEIDGAAPTSPTYGAGKCDIELDVAVPDSSAILDGWIWVDAAGVSRGIRLRADVRRPDSRGVSPHRPAPMVSVVWEALGEYISPVPPRKGPKSPDDGLSDIFRRPRTSGAKPAPASTKAPKSKSIGAGAGAPPKDAQGKGADSPNSSDANPPGGKSGGGEAVPSPQKSPPRGLSKVFRPKSTDS